jgi:protocatechuate 3,4-dioxygenase beta subunit
MRYKEGAKVLNSPVVSQAAILIGLTFVPLGAQSPMRMVHGVVLDRQSHPVDHAAVQIENGLTLQIRSYVTQSDGEYHFAGLSPDYDYKITAEYDGVRSASRTLSKFDSHTNSGINLTIRFGK